MYAIVIPKRFKGSRGFHCPEYRSEAAHAEFFYTRNKPFSGPALSPMKMRSNSSIGHAELFRGLAAQLRQRNAEQTWAFKDVFTSHEGLLRLNEKLRQQTLDQDKVGALF